MQVFSKEQHELVNIYVCIHKISYSFFQNFVAFPKIPFIYAFSKKKIMHAYILKENKNKSKKNHTFINAFLKRKSPKFHQCIFS